MQKQAGNTGQRHETKKPEYDAVGARKVQNRLLRSHLPRISSLDVEAFYLPAHAVGGDYYDFLPLGSSRVGLALGDISGKGVGGAILMASLQAMLRSQGGRGAGDLAALLRSANRLFHECTAAHHFATLFLGDYDERTRRLRYANCGHNPPLLIHSDLSVQRLHPTATVLGMFEEWSCAVHEVHLDLGDTLILYTDGLVDAVDRDDNEFGEEGVIGAFAAHRRLPLPALTRAMVRTQADFTFGRREDDMTLVIARPRCELELVA